MVHLAFSSALRCGPQPFLECIPIWSWSLTKMHSHLVCNSFWSAITFDPHHFQECTPKWPPYKKFPHVDLKTCLNLRHVSIHLFELGFYIDFMLGYVRQSLVDNVNLTHLGPVYVLVTGKMKRFWTIEQNLTWKQLENKSSFLQSECLNIFEEILQADIQSDRPILGLWNSRNYWFENPPWLKTISTSVTSSGPSPADLIPRSTDADLENGPDK